MPILLEFKCSGCSKTAAGTGTLRRTFRSFSGRDYGFGKWQLEPVLDLTPEGWVAFDPYTNLTYCPECWKMIEDDTNEAAEAAPADE